MNELAGVKGMIHAYREAAKVGLTYANDDAQAFRFRTVCEGLGDELIDIADAVAIGADFFAVVNGDVLP